MKVVIKNLKSEVVLALLCALLLSECVPVVAGGAATIGYSAAQERSVGDAVDDTTIMTKINSSYLQSNFDGMFRTVDVSVNEGRVLLTGTVKNPDNRLEAVRLAWLPHGVKEVINEIQVVDQTSFKTYAEDTWITAQVKGKLLLNKDIKSINYNIDTVNSVVYIMGIAQSAEELRDVTNIASIIKGVKNVVSHVRMKDDPSRN